MNFYVFLFFPGNSKKRKKSKVKDLDCSNSKLVMNTLVSEATRTEDQYTDALEYERKNLIEYIKTYTKRNGKLPRTSLQFYKVKIHSKNLLSKHSNFSTKIAS